MLGVEICHMIGRMSTQHLQMRVGGSCCHESVCEDDARGVARCMDRYLVGSDRIGLRLRRYCLFCLMAHGRLDTGVEEREGLDHIRTQAVAEMAKAVVSFEGMQ